jgi:hypothetical protein
MSDASRVYKIWELQQIMMTALKFPREGRKEGMEEGRNGGRREGRKEWRKEWGLKREEEIVNRGGPAVIIHVIRWSHR